MPPGRSALQPWTRGNRRQAGPRRQWSGHVPATGARIRLRTCVHRPITGLVEEALHPADVQQTARRIRMGARLVLYPFLLLLVVAGWQLKQHASHASLGVKWSG